MPAFTNAHDIRQWLGAYQAVVARNNDPLGQKRVIVNIPQILGPNAESQWAVPISATAGDAPAPGTVVTIMFLGGDVNHPGYLVPVLATSGGSGATIDTDAADIAPLGSRAAGSVGLAADSGHVHPMPSIDQLVAPAADVPWNSHKITGLASGTASGDAVNHGQLGTAAFASTADFDAAGAAASAVATETSRAEAAEALLLPLAGGTMSGVINMGSHKVINLTNGSSAQDAAAFGQIPTSLPPSGSASGDLSGSYPGPTVAKIDGIALSGTPVISQSLVATSTSAAEWAFPGLQPSGDTSGATDLANIQGLLNLGNITVTLGTGTFFINAPITIPPACGLAGQYATTQVSEMIDGTVIKVVSGFTGLTISDGGSVTLKGAVVLLGKTFGGYSENSMEQKIRNIMFQGSSAPSGTNGLVSYGAASRVHLSEVLFTQFPGDGIQQNVDVAGDQPDAWFGFKVFSRFNGGHGFVLRSADSTWFMSLGSNNGATDCDWFLNSTSNSKLYACRSEHGAGIGFGFVCTNSANSSGDVIFQGCSTDQSGKHGFQIGGTINGVTSFVHSTPVVLNGCVSRRDGANSGSGGGGYAGFYIADYGSVVVLSGCNSFPGVNDFSATAVSPSVGADITTIASWSSPASGTLAVSSVTGFATSGNITVLTSGGTATLSYTGLDAVNNYFTGCALVSGTGNVSSTSSGVNSPNSPQIGFLADSGSQAVVSGSYFHAATTAVTDNSGGTINWDNSVATAVGSTSSPTIDLSPGLANYQGVSLTLMPPASPATAPLEIQSNASTNRAFGIRVAGLSNENLKITADGKMAWSSGGAVQDISVNRSAAGVLNLTDNGAGNSIQLKWAASASQSGTTALARIIANASGDRILTGEVTSDADPRLIVDSNGKQSWGSGAATADTALSRTQAGALSVSTDGAAGTPQPIDPYGGGYGYFQPTGALGHGNIPRAQFTVATIGSANVSGTVYLVAYYYPAGTQITNVHYFTGTGTMKTGGTHGWYVVCTSDLKVRAASADQTDPATVWGTASTDYGLAVLTSTSAKYVTPYSGLFYHGIMVAETAGSMPNLVAGPAMTTGVSGISPFIASPCTGVTGTSLTTPPTADGSVTLVQGSASGTINFLTWAS